MIASRGPKQPSDKSAMLPSVPAIADVVVRAIQPFAPLAPGRT